MLRMRTIGAPADPRFFVLEYDDWRHILKTDNRPTAVRKSDTENIRIDTFDGHSLHAFTTKPGVFDLVAWGAVQTGRKMGSLVKAAAESATTVLAATRIPRI
jgi:hypothetical protein